MISYELAKKLKEAGFRQSGLGLFLFEENKPRHESIKPMDTKCPVCEDTTCNPDYNPYRAYEPTLSELIEACMDFHSPAHFEMGGWNTWWAILRNENQSKVLGGITSGKTPSEAVANLWLELNRI